MELITIIKKLLCVYAMYEKYDLIKRKFHFIIMGGNRAKKVKFFLPYFQSISIVFKKLIFFSGDNNEYYISIRYECARTRFVRDIG